MKRVRGGSGLGDSLYVRPIVDYLVGRGEAVTALTNYPDIFAGSGATVEPFTRERINVLAHYTSRKYDRTTTQWQDILRAARAPEDLPLRFLWAVRNQALVEKLRDDAAGRQIVLVHGGRTPMGRSDGFGRELLPERQAFKAALGAFTDCYRVRVGNGQQLYPLPADVDLCSQTSVSDLLDLAASCDAIVAQCSFAVPLAECFDKPLLAVWSARGLACNNRFISAITPRKILSKPTSRYVRDDWPIEQIREAASAFRNS